MRLDQKNIKDFLDKKVNEYNQPSFIIKDPVSIPRRFSKKQDIEIAGFFAAIFSWGNRTTIIQKAGELMQLMDNAPHQFILQHKDRHLKKMMEFKHRTFNATDLYYFIEFFKHHYSKYDSLEDAFLRRDDPGSASGTTGEALTRFYTYFFSLEDAPHRTRKHIASPEKNSSCKRLNMYLRWMVRKDANGVDFGIWERMSPSALICPLDVHVARVAKRLGLLTRTQSDWQAAQELTDYLVLLDKDDPVKYDFALFGLGVMEKF
ncbi:TIGR02757 family protein [Flavitalea flava]